MTMRVEAPRVDAGKMVAMQEDLHARRAAVWALPQVSASPVAVIILDEALTSADDNAAAILEQLARKVEVGKRLRASYLGGLGASIEDVPADPAVVQYLGALFVYVGLTRGDWKLLNTAMKMEGGIVDGRAVDLPTSASAALEFAIGEAS
jgi:hypothetical protein